MDIKEVLVLLFINFLIKRLPCQISNFRMNSINQLLKKLKEEKYIIFKDNICCADFADMQVISKFNKGIRLFIIC